MSYWTTDTLKDAGYSCKPCFDHSGVCIFLSLIGCCFPVGCCHYLMVTNSNTLAMATWGCTLQSQLKVAFHPTNLWSASLNPEKEPSLEAKCSAGEKHSNLFTSPCHLQCNFKAKTHILNNLWNNENRWKWFAQYRWLQKYWNYNATTLYIPIVFHNNQYF